MAVEAVVGPPRPVAQSLRERPVAAVLLSAERSVSAAAASSGYPCSVAVRSTSTAEEVVQSPGRTQRANRRQRSRTVVGSVSGSATVGDAVGSRSVAGPVAVDGVDGV
ncbi:hypothetical protein GJ629_14525, partial [Halapricum sp. CBA1109]|uniref:hypothetical protein n=1 Tax=Halapricum sp. CBA1109 TaxID=2668068 RepID=UPI0012F959E2